MQELKIKISEEQKQGLENGKFKLAIVEADKLDDVKGGLKLDEFELTRVTATIPKRFMLVK